MAYVWQRLLPMPTIADRRSYTHAAELRRALREADERLYLQKAALDESLAERRKPNRGVVAAACVGAGFLLIGASEFKHSGTAAETDAVQATVAMPALAHDIQLSADADVAPPAAIAPVRELASPHHRATHSTVRRAAAVSRAPVARTRTSRARVLNRMRLGWLRKVFTPKSDSL